MGEKKCFQHMLRQNPCRPLYLDLTVLKPATRPRSLQFNDQQNSREEANRGQQSIPEATAFLVPSTSLNKRPHMLRTWRNNTRFSSVLTNYRLSQTQILEARVSNYTRTQSLSLNF
ncbi:hypothetical protein L798_14811 [Zootermopsis nevadensis]|uniref:Uncharacterized protein n=1 Tax=Zootermopsis nevadensis TaxID=136037 RepID=A0A067QNB9_ZOONE|nr:hypothetical protein L798_14811 [Zootermopsis nevadensis]